MRTSVISILCAADYRFVKLLQNIKRMIERTVIDTKGDLSDGI
jgi:hypothetical protein